MRTPSQMLLFSLYAGCQQNKSGAKYMAFNLIFLTKIRKASGPDDFSFDE